MLDSCKQLGRRERRHHLDREARLSGKHGNALGIDVIRHEDSQRAAGRLGRSGYGRRGEFSHGRADG